jgi:hypothetical protein
MFRRLVAVIVLGFFDAIAANGLAPRASSRSLACISMLISLFSFGGPGLAVERGVGRYNVIWNSPSKDAAGVMPIGNGDIAAGVYAIENGDLYLLLAMRAGSAADRGAWRKLRAEIPEIPMRTLDGRQAIAPARTFEKQHNAENGELYPVFPFRCFGLGLGSRDLVEWTMNHRTCPDSNASSCWSQDQIQWAYAGNAAEAASGLVRRFRIASPQCRFPLYGRQSPDSCPDFEHFGSGSIAFQRMLVQEAAGKILLLPAWPSSWNVDFKLHVSRNTTINGCVKDGKLIHWTIDPPSRKQDVVVDAPQEALVMGVIRQKAAGY